MTKLTEIAIKKAKPGTSIRKLSDGNGLVLLVYPNGSKYWAFRYRYLGKEKNLSLGIYPTVSLAQARRKLADARNLLSEGQDPSEARKAEKRQALVSAENNFEAIAREWIGAKSPAWTPRYAGFLVGRLEKDIFPRLGTRPIKEISPPELLSVVRMIESRGASELAHRVLNCCGQIFMYGIATGRAERNPANDLQGALKTHVKTHYAHLKAVELPEFLERLAKYDGHPQTRLAVTLLMLTFVRTTELRGATWDEIDLDKSEWRIPAERMKMRRDHIVPLSRQAVAGFKELKRLNGQWKFVFPNPHKPLKHMSENAVLYALYRMGYHNRTTGHGFRHTASTILNESNLFSPDAIERQLAHVQGNKVRAAYNHAQYLPERRQMMQWWADYLDGLTA
ncbi:tyrosine-type recombinase/integrase [bacterium]|nr:tyrosine-type recombinase/integrase [bacterium]